VPRPRLVTVLEAVFSLLAQEAPMSFTARHVSRWLLLLAGLALAACETTGGRGLVKDARGDELRKETTLGVTLPPGCTTSTTSIPDGKKNLTVSYKEPAAEQNGAPLKELAYTTIYLSSPKGPAQAIRVWTNDAHGGAFVTITNVDAPAQEFVLCVTATNWAKMESPPALLTPSAR
jgi:hypothetical protein